MDDSLLNKLYSELLTDYDFEYLDIKRNQPNIFEILGVKHYEIRHSNFLAWLLNPYENHGVGDYFLKRLMLDVFRDKRSCKNVIDIHDLLKEDIIIHREKHNIDILIEFQTAVIVIENKINAVEGKYQLQTYLDLIKDKYSNKSPIFIYLTKFGTQASLKEDFIELSYQDILKYLDELIEYRKENISKDVLVYIKDYINNLNKNIMQQDPSNAIAQKIYKNHKDLFDFIIKNIPDNLAIVKEEINKLLILNGFVLGSDYKSISRFLPKEIATFVPQKKQTKDWKNGEAFLIEIFYQGDNNKIIFQIAISSYVIDKRDFFKKLFEEAGLRFDIEVKEEWYVFERNEFDFNFDRFDEIDYIKEKYNNIMTVKKDPIKKLITIIKENSNDLCDNEDLE